MRRWVWIIGLLVVAAGAAWSCAKRAALEGQQASYGMMRGRAGGMVASAPPAPAEAPMPLSGESMDKSAAQTPGGGAPSFSPQAYGRTVFNVERWFSPAAYAEEARPQEEYLIRNGEMALRIDNYDKAEKAAADLADKMGGTVTDRQMTKNYDGTREGWVVLRVPASHFLDAWNQLRQIGEVTSENTTAEDVSTQYVSAVSRMKNRLQEQETLHGMLDDARQVQRTRGLGEAYKVLLDTQARLSDVTLELQTTQDTIDQLADKITRSSIKVTLSERAAYQSEEFTWGFGATLKAAYKDVLLGVKNTANALIYFVVTSVLWLPWVVIVAVVIWWIAAARRRRLKAKAAAATPQGS